MLMQIDLTFHNLGPGTKGGAGPRTIGHFQMNFTHTDLLVRFC